MIERRKKTEFPQYEMAETNNPMDIKENQNTLNQMDSKCKAAAVKKEAEVQFYGITLEEFRKDCEYN